MIDFNVRFVFTMHSLTVLNSFIILKYANLNSTLVEIYTNFKLRNRQTNKSYSKNSVLISMNQDNF